MHPKPGYLLLDLYETALPQVYGYLLSRCGNRAVAEDLTAETFLAAVSAVREQADSPVGPAWLIGVARHKLVDHWRRQEREERGPRAAPRTLTEALLVRARAAFRRAYEGEEGPR